MIVEGVWGKVLVFVRWYMEHERPRAKVEVVRTIIRKKSGTKACITITCCNKSVVGSSTVYEFQPVSAGTTFFAVFSYALNLMLSLDPLLLRLPSMAAHIPVFALPKTIRQPVYRPHQALVHT
jgi:hypothetical protein